MKHVNLTYHLATIEDLDTLTENRIRVLRAANQLSDSVDVANITRETRNYYLKSFKQNAHIAYLVYDGDRVVAAVGVSFFQVMPTFSNPSGKKAYIMNMWTAPSYRRKGIARQTLDLLVSAAKSKGIDFIALEATEMGRPLYEKYGFRQMSDEMYLPEGIAVPQF